MDVYDSEREQLDAIKGWWKENGRVVTIGLVLGLGGVFGWTSWQSYAKTQAEQASILYEELVNWASVENYNRANEIAGNLMLDYPGSGYAALGALIRASNAFALDKPDEAQAYLQWVVENAQRAELKQLARLRIARLLVNKEDYAAALRLLDQSDVGPFLPQNEEVRGDILAAQGQHQAAAEAYQKAMAADVASQAGRQRVAMKLADLGVDSSAPAESTE